MKNQSKFTGNPRIKRRRWLHLHHRGRGAVVVVVVEVVVVEVICSRREKGAEGEVSARRQMKLRTLPCSKCDSILSTSLLSVITLGNVKKFSSGSELWPLRPF